MTITPTPSAQSGSMWGDLLSSPLTAAAVVVAMSGVVAIFAPNLVTGSEHEQLPLAALTIWPWTAAAVGYVLIVVPPFGAVATGFLAIAHARAVARRASEG
jgi:hypothetical protein